MLSFFRSDFGSKFVAVFLGMVLFAMVATGVGTQGGGLSSITSLLGANRDTIATVGDVTLSPADVTQRATEIVEQQRRQQPDATLQSLAAAGLVPQIVDSMLNERSLEKFAEVHGMKVSKRSVDAIINEVEAFKGPDGKFDAKIMAQRLAPNHYTEQMYRDAVARELLTDQITVPLKGATSMPKSLVKTYAALFLEVREGRVGGIPAAAMTKTPKPTEAEISGYYKAHPTNYTLPERRVIEYVVYDKAKFADAGKPTDAEIAAIYAQKKDIYTPHETRTITQLVIPDETKARAAYAKAKAGTALADAAKGDGFQAITFAAQDKAAYASNAAPDVADVAFKAEGGTLAPLTKSALGWFIVHVDKVTHDPGKSLDAARPEIVKGLQPVLTERLEKAFADFQNKLSDRASAGGSITDLAKIGGAEVVTTPAIDRNGQAEAQSGYQPSPDMAGVLKDAFKPDSKVSSEPLITSYGAARDKFAFYHVKAITPAGPEALAKAHDRVAQDAYADAQARAARAVAQAVVDKVNHGTSLADALKATGLPLPPVGMVKTNKLLIQQREMQSHQPTPQAVKELFNAPLHHAKMIAAPNNAGWSIIWLDSKTAVDPDTQPQFLAQVQQQFGPAYGQELVSAFASAAQQKLGAKKYPSNISALASSMSGAGAQ